jgi:hypothetical protein
MEQTFSHPHQAAPMARARSTSMERMPGTADYETACTARRFRTTHLNRS